MGSPSSSGCSALALLVLHTPSSTNTLGRFSIAAHMLASQAGRYLPEEGGGIL